MSRPKKMESRRSRSVNLTSRENRRSLPAWKTAMSPSARDEERSFHPEVAHAHGNGAAVPTPSEGFTFAEIVRCSLRHKWKVSFFVGVTLAVTVAAALNWPKTYRSEAKLYVRVGRESVGLDPTATLGRGTVGL